MKANGVGFEAMDTYTGLYIWRSDDGMVDMRDAYER